MLLHKIKIPQGRIAGIALMALILVTGSGCKKYLTLPLPVDRVTNGSVFANDQLTAGVLNNVYYTLQLSGNLEGQTSLGMNAGLYTDDLQTLSNSSAVAKSFYANIITGTNGGGTLWSNLYVEIYTANTVIEGMKGSTLPYKDQWLGEAYFVRALCYYYLVNVYGDVALVLSSDYKSNNTLSRVPASQVYPQMVADLKQAQTLLSADYLDFNGNVVSDKARPNKAAATALLARVYLYQGDWVNSEAQASAVIGNTAYAMETLPNVFLISGKEVIWGLLPTSGLSYAVPEAKTYIITPGANPIASGALALISPQLLGSFEANDARYANWVGISTTAGVTSYFVNKYKIKAGSAPAETYAVLRLAEQYLIRAEARAKQNNLLGSIVDLNVIRSRAGLPATTAASQADLLNAVLQERRIELFAEAGHRFFDLKRTGNIDAVMGVVSPQKNSKWASYMQYWPIATTETINDPNLKQTPGYQQ